MISSIRIFAALLLLSTGNLIASDVSDAALRTEARIFDCKPGAWGRVQWHYIHLEAPDWIVEHFDTPHTQPAWFFPKAEASQLVKFLLEAGVSQSMMDRWFADRRMVNKGPEAITIFPPTADVVGLEPRTRSLIYAELAKASQNEFHANPVKILDENVDVWLGLRVVRPEIRELLKKLTYLQGTVLCFSDLSVLLSHAKDKDEVNDMIKLITRCRAVMAYLQVDMTDDSKKLEAYWSAGYRRKDVLPMLHSVSRLPGGGRLGFSHLLPAEARKLIYTYPTLAMAARGRMPDCHWTALNFFNSRPQNVFLDLRLVAAQMLEGHEVVQPPYAYGDVIVFLNKAGQGQHSCVYLCDDLVYSKNGETASAPWLLCTLSDVRRIYAHLDEGEIKVFRRQWAVDAE